jgi:hypothetical protein
MADFNQKKDALKAQYEQAFAGLNKDAPIIQHVNILGEAIKALIELNKKAVTDSELFKRALRDKITAILSSRVGALNLKLQELEDQLKAEKEKVNANAVEIQRLTVEIDRNKGEIEQAKVGIREAFIKVFAENNINDIDVDEIVNNVTNGLAGEQAGGYFYSNTGRGIKKNKSRKSKKGGKSLRKRSKKVVRKRTKSKSKRRYHK